jgi:hypothetical protein
MRRFPGRLLTLLAIFILAAQPALAHDPQHGRVDDFWNHHKVPGTTVGASSTPVADNFTVLGHANLGGGVPNGDVWFFDHGGSVGKFAYVGTWSAQCTGQGAKIIDVNDPTTPQWVGFVGARKGSSNEDVVVARIGSRDVLAIGVQPCGRRGESGLALYDVTDPRNPSELSFFPTPSGVHELDLAVRADGTALAAMALPFNEAPILFGEDFGGEVWIADITDPTSPAPVSDWGIIGDSNLIIQGGNDEVTSSFQGLGFFAATLAHSVRFADAGTSLYASYWDAGFLKLDVTNPSTPILDGRTLYGTTDAGDGHSLTPYDVGGTRYLLTNDEDFAGIPETIAVTTSATGTSEFPGIQEPWAPTSLYSLAGGTVTGAVHDAGDGCEAADYDGASGKVALADSVDPFYPEDFGEVPCAIGTQATLAAQAGAVAFVSNLLSFDDPYPFGPDADVSATVGMPILQIADIDDVADAIRAAPGEVTLTATSEDPPTWGHLRVYAETGGTEWSQVGEFMGPAQGPNTPPGSWSIHNTEVLGNRAYSSWYSAGIVALDMTNPASPVQVGQFVPDTSKRHANSLGTGPAEVWGVAIDPATGIVYASDMRTGLWIVQPTGAAAVP